MHKISCLCVTNNRVNQLKNAIACFDAQTYVDKELVIVCLSNDKSSVEFLAQMKNHFITYFLVEDSEHLTLGDLRNIAIEKASGSYICNWDDDDWYHPDRLKIQMWEMRFNGMPASILSYLLLYNTNTGDAYITNKRQWENSICCEKKLLEEYSIKYPSLDKGEDTPFVSRLREIGVLFSIAKPHLYIYCFTGNNTCSNDHFRVIFQHSKKLSVALTKKIGLIVSGELTIHESARELDRNKLLMEFNYD